MSEDIDEALEAANCKIYVLLRAIAIDGSALDKMIPRNDFSGKPREYFPLTSTDVEVCGEAIVIYPDDYPPPSDWSYGGNDPYAWICSTANGLKSVMDKGNK